MTATYRHTDDRRLVPTKQLQSRPFEDVPTADRLIRGSGEEDLPLLVRRHARDPSLVLLEHAQTLARLEGPGARREVGGARDQDVLVAVPVVLRVVLLLLPGTRTRGRAGVLGRRDEDEGIDAALVAAEDADALARVEVPAARRAVVGTAEDEVASADDAVEQRRVTAEHVHAVARAHLPLPDRLVGAARHDEVVLDQAAVDVVLVALQDADALAERRLRRPQAGRAVLAAGG